MLGYKLGNSFREHDRLLGIYRGDENGVRHPEWEDPEVYLRERCVPHEEEIDGKKGRDNPLHARAAASLAVYDKEAAKITYDAYNTHPEKFEEVKLKPMLHLVELYKRLGISMTLMTANPPAYVDAVGKVLGFADSFIDVATDETMFGGGKDLCMEHLIKSMESKGVKISRDRLIAVGDSIRGDVGSVSKVKGVVSPKGILVLHDRAALEKMKQQIKDDPKLEAIVSAIDTEAIVLDEVPVDERGKPRLGSAFRSQFIERL